MAITYILKSQKTAKTYVGSTLDLKRRIKEHNDGESTFTKKFRPWNIVYTEEFETITEARTREKYFKSAAGRRFIKKNNIIPA